MQILRGLIGGLTAERLWDGWVSVVKKVFADTRNATQETGDKFQATMTGMQFAYKKFTQIIATGDWSHFMTNIRAAIQAGKEYQMMMDEVFELQNSQTIQETLIQNEIAIQQEIMDNVTLSNEERKAAAQTIIGLYQKIGDIRKNTAQQEMDANTEKFTDFTEMSKEEREYIIDNYHSNRKAIVAATKLVALQKELTSLQEKASRGAAGNINAYQEGAFVGSGTDYSDQISSVQAAISKVRGEYKGAAKDLEYASSIVKKYNMATDEDIAAYVKSYNKWLGVDGEVARMARSAAAQEKNLFKQISDQAATDLKNRQQQSLQEQQAAYDASIKAAEDAHTKEITELKRAYAQMEFDQTEYAAKIEAAELDLIERRILINSLYGKETNSLYQQLYDKQIAQAQKVAAEIDKILAAAAAADDAAITAELDSYSPELTEEEQNFLREKQEFNRLSDKSKKMFPESTSSEDALNTELADLQGMLDMKLITEEQYCQYLG